MLFLSHWSLISEATWLWSWVLQVVFFTFTYLYALHLHIYVVFIYIVPFAPFSRKRDSLEPFFWHLSIKPGKWGLCRLADSQGGPHLPWRPQKSHIPVSRWKRQSKASSTWPAKDGAGSCWPVWGWGRPSFPRGTACGRSGQAGFWTPSGRWSKSACSWHQIVPQTLLWFGHCWRVGSHGKEGKQEFITRPHTYNVPILFI